MGGSWRVSGLDFMTHIICLLTLNWYEVLSQIEEVSIDLWQGYKNLVTELMPLAQVVADRFHVMAQINQELDRQRKIEKRNLEKLVEQGKPGKNKTDNELKLSSLKKSKYLLLKNEDIALLFDF
jgi:transposase